MAGVSDTENKHIIREWLIENRKNFKRVLDVGAGVGTYSLMGKFPEQHWVALEVFGQYVEMFNLENKYNKVVVSDARFTNYNALGSFDLTIAADMIEHMRKHEAQDLINKLLKHTKKLLICFPVEHNHQHAGPEGNQYETHVDHWHVVEMKNFLSRRNYEVIEGKVCAYFIISGDKDERI
jgi:predicted TPR repeat methyltransferase